MATFNLWPFLLRSHQRSFPTKGENRIGRLYGKVVLLEQEMTKRNLRQSSLQKKEQKSLLQILTLIQFLK